MTATLMPGLSTQTQFARYYCLYWAVADHAERAGLDADACRRMIRRSELLLAFVTDHVNGREIVAHGADALVRGRTQGSGFWAMAANGPGTYSPRAWGFWGQYGGPSDALGTVITDGRALRPSRHPCPPRVREFYAPLLAIAGSTADPDPEDLLPLLQSYDVGDLTGPDLHELGELFAASRGARHDPDAWETSDRSRRATLRILARSATLHPETSLQTAMRSSVAYGDAADTDPVLLAEADRAMAWRGLLLRHRSVGAWRRLWAGLVAHIHDGLRIATRDDLHAWVADPLPDETVNAFVAGLPPVVDGTGRPVDAETAVAEQSQRSPVEQHIAVLLLGARRVGTMDGKARAAFDNARAYLSPVWVADQIAEHSARSVRDLARALVDDMLAQSRRVALRKTVLTGDRMRVFTRLHERNGFYTAGSREGRGNVGLRIEQLTALAIQVGLLSPTDGLMTERGADLLEMPR